MVMVTVILLVAAVLVVLVVHLGVVVELVEVEVRAAVVLAVAHMDWLVV